MHSIFAALALPGSAAAFSRLFVLSNRPDGRQLKAPLQVQRSSLKISVRPLCSLCLSGEWLPTKFHHRDTEITKVAQRKAEIKSLPNFFRSLKQLVSTWSAF